MINLGSTPISRIYVGSDEVSKVFLGDKQVYPNYTLSLSLSATHLDFVAQGEVKDLTINAAEGQVWELTKSGNFEVSATTGTGTQSVTITATNNTSTNQITGDIQVTSGDLTASCSLTQEAGIKVYGEITVTSFTYATISASGGTIFPTISYSQPYTWNEVVGSGGNITTGATVVYTGDNVDTQGNVTAPSKELVISDRSKVTTVSVSVTLNGKSTTAQADIYQEANTRALTSVEIRQNGGGADLTTQFSAAGGSGYYAPYGTYTYTSGSTKWVELDTQTTLSSWSIDQSWITLSAYPTYGWTVIAKAENRGTTAGNQRTATLKLSVGNLSDSIILTQEANIRYDKRTVLHFDNLAGPTSKTVSAAGGEVFLSVELIRGFSSGAEGDPYDVTNSSNITVTGTGFNIQSGRLIVSSRGTEIGPIRTGTLKAIWNGLTSPDTICTQEANEQKQTACSIEIDHDYQDPLGYNNTNVPAAGGRVCIVGVRHYSYTSGATSQIEYDSFTLNCNQSWCVSDDASNLTISSRGTVTGSDRSATVYWQDGSFKSNEMTITQKANTATYGGVTINGGSVSVIPASGGSVSSMSGISASQTVSFTSGTSRAGSVKITYSSAVSASSKGTSISNQTTAGTLTATATGEGSKTATKALTVYQAGNYVTAIKGSLGTFSYPTISAGATSATPNTSVGFGVLFTFSSGSTASNAPASTYGSLSVPSSFKLSASQNGFTAVNSSTGVLTATNRGTTVGAARTSGTVTRTLTATWTPTSSYNAAGTKTNSWSTTATCTQAANTITWNTPTISRTTPVSMPVGGGTNNVATGLTYSQTGQYSSGSPASASSGGSLSYSVVTAKTGFSLAGSTVTVTNNTSTSARNGFVVRITLKLNGVTATKDITYNQIAGYYTYANPTVNLSYPVISAAGGTVNPSLSYSQTYGWNGATSGAGTITSGGTISYSGTSVNTSNGSVTAGSKGMTVSGVTTVTTASVTVTLNGKKGSKSVTVQQAANSVKSYSNILINQFGYDNIPYSGGTSSPTMDITYDVTYDSGTYRDEHGLPLGYSITYATSGSWFNLNASTGVITAPNNTTADIKSVIVTAKLSRNSDHVVITSAQTTVKQDAKPGPVDIYITTSFDYASSRIQVNFSSAPRDTFFIKFVGYDQSGSIWEGVTGVTPSYDTSFTYAPSGYLITDQFSIEGLGATEYTISPTSPYETSNARYYWQSTLRFKG